MECTDIHSKRKKRNQASAQKSRLYEKMKLKALQERLDTITAELLATPDDPEKIRQSIARIFKR